MEVHYGLDQIHIAAPVATIGSFDGLHLGHMQVLEGLKRCAREWEGETVIITFEPHPREVLFPMEKRPGILTALNEKIEILESYGIDHLIIIKFTEALAAMSYGDFVRNILVDKIGIKALVIGYDHRLGKDREGNFDVLKVLAQQYHFELKQEQVYTEDEINVSSTKIRTALELGEIQVVNKLLGYDYKISGEVVHGDRIGRSIGFPTANIKVNDERKLFPATGVYVVKVKIDDQEYGGMVNIGVRPTVSKAGIIRPEVNIFDFDGDLYGQCLTLSFIARIRGERRFDNTEELRLQLQQDFKQAQEILAN
ncbi:bifunctional riboflavin kinase/FAD synthetase [Odoribacter sp. OttesenSCG-928-J03]|nr:bifunctional riboflavin kinase/FAD synthetase [Odoribacter sp. OttesenSCG-928-J03]